MPLCEWHESKPGGKAAFIRQRVEDNAFEPIKGDRLLLKPFRLGPVPNGFPPKVQGPLGHFRPKENSAERAGQARLRRSTELLLRLKNVNA
jgi:hypothetical protein